MQQNSQGKTVMVTGRIVWTSGDLFKGRPKLDLTTKAQKVDKAGNPMMEYGFGLAVPKAMFSQAGENGALDLWNAIHEEAFSLFPQARATGQVPPSFAMKYKDGDSIDDKGVPFAAREGYAGALVFACTTSLPIKYFKFENGQNFMVNEGIKCGDYVKVQLQIKAHPALGQGKAGLYINPNAVQLIGYGKEIVNTPSGDQIFGTAQPGLPAGASSMPVAQPGMLIPPSAVGPAPGIPMGAPGMPAAAPAAPSPHFGVLPQIHQPPAGGAYGTPPAQPTMGNVQQPAGYPAPGAAATPMGAPMPPSFATNVNPYGQQVAPAAPGYPQQQPGFPGQWPQQ